MKKSISHNLMKEILKILVLLLCSNQFLFAQQSIPLSEEKTIELYDSLYLSSEINTVVWNGSTTKCKPGNLSGELYTKAQNRINFFRLVNGLEEVKNNPDLNLNSQKAALLVKANNHLTHYPKSNMKCYSKAASDGCLKSCLSFSDWKNYPKTSFVTGFIQDYGDENYFVGHRKWLLYTKLTEFGYGATNTSEAILTADGVSYDAISAVEFIAYPWYGYVPVDLIFPKWSFSISQDQTVDFSDVEIILKDESGKIIQIKKLKEYKNYLDHTIVWTVNGLFTDYEIQYAQNHLEENSYLNKKITVEIKNVIVNGKKKNYKYWVKPIKA